MVTLTKLSVRLTTHLEISQKSEAPESISSRRRFAGWRRGYRYSENLVIRVDDLNNFVAVIVSCNYRRHCYLPALSIFSLAILREPSTLSMPPRTTMEPQRISSIKDSLKEMSMEELQEMSESLHDLIHVLYTRQVAVEDAILDRLEYAFIR
jgi:hypothetical protein